MNEHTAHHTSENFSTKNNEYLIGVNPINLFRKWSLEIPAPTNTLLHDIKYHVHQQDVAPPIEINKS